MNGGFGSRLGAVDPPGGIDGLEPFQVRDMSSQTMTSGVMRLTYLTPPRTRRITTMLAYTGSTAAGATPTVCRVGVFSVASDGALTLLDATANDLTLFNGANQEFPKALANGVTCEIGQRYAFGVLVVSGATMPSFLGISIPAAVIARAPRRAAIVSGLADLPASVAAGSVANNQTWLYVAGI